MLNMEIVLDGVEYVVICLDLMTTIGPLWVLGAHDTSLHAQIMMSC